ncbi:MAG: ABC transporter substrate-binding protein [Alphaproteobacteria bacterium]|nr:ABC transporter substrate-binding protein [Alphaproteobacteria bacterium]
MKRILLGAAAAAALAVSAIGAANGQTLRVSNLDAPPNRGDPHTGLSYQHVYTWEALHDALTTVEGDGRPNGRLTASWENKGPDTWLFKLKPGLKFHSGQAFTADAIVSSVRYIISDAGKAEAAAVYGSLRHLASATKVDDLTVEIKTTGPSPILPAEISALKIVDPKAWGDLGRQGFANAPSGSGPFRVTLWDNTKVEMTRFNDGPRGAPKVAGIQMYFMPEGATRVQAFASGGVDIALGVGADSKGAIENARGRINAGAAPSVSVLTFNQSKGGYTLDKRVRQAMNFSIDKSYAQTLLGGHTVAAGQPAPRTVYGHQTDIKPYAYDPEKAKALLAEAGFKDGLKAVAEIVTNNPDLVNVYQHAAQNLQKVGVTLELRTISLPDLVARVNGQKQPEGEMHVFNYGANPSNDVMRSINAFHSCKFAQKWTCFPEIEDTITAINTDFDVAKRAANLRKLAQFYHDMAPSLWLYEQYELDATSPKVKNYKNENWRINWGQIELGS